MYVFLYRCELFVRDPRERRWMKAMNVVSDQFCRLLRWIPVYSGLIDLTEIVILSWHGFSFLNPEIVEYLKESKSWNNPRTELCLSAGKRKSTMRVWICI